VQTSEDEPVRLTVGDWFTVTLATPVHITAFVTVTVYVPARVTPILAVV
jgi:hypothetical protein